MQQAALHDNVRTKEKTCSDLNFPCLQSSDGSVPLGVAVMKTFDVSIDKNRYWIGVAALLGFIVFYNVLFTLALVYLNRKNSPF